VLITAKAKRATYKIERQTHRGKRKRDRWGKINQSNTQANELLNSKTLRPRAVTRERTETETRVARPDYNTPSQWLTADDDRTGTERQEGFQNQKLTFIFSASREGSNAEHVRVTALCCDYLNYWYFLSRAW
jgi:hypothetical protein